MKRVKGILSGVVFLGLGAFLFYLILDFDRLSHFSCWKNVEYRFLLFSFISAFLATFVVGLRWFWIFKYLFGGKTENKINYYYYLMISKLAGFFVPTHVSAIGIRSIILKADQGESFRKGGFSIIVDRIFDLLVFAAIIVPGVLFFSPLNLRLSYIITITIIFIFLLFLLLRYSRLNFVRLLLKMGSKLGNKLKINWLIVENIDKISNRLSPTRMVGLLGLSICKYFFVAGRIFWIARALKIEVGFPPIFYGTVVGEMSIWLSLTPAGLGIFEGSWWILLTYYGATSSDAMVLLSAHRGLWLIFIFFLSVCSFIVKICNDYFNKKTHRDGV